MVFASLVFLFLFLPLNLLLYYASGNKVYRNWLLILFSLFFYAWGEPVWILLMIFSAFVDYANGLVIEKYRGTIWSKVGLISSLSINLGLLILFKYSGFLYENVNALTGLKLQAPEFSLPIGISFYTFQTISYTIDVYRNEVQAQRSFPKFLLFVSLYHQLVAGPIVRYVHVANEIENRQVRLSDFSYGINRFCIGLFKKVFFANVAGELASRYLDADLSTLSVGAAWTGLLMFSLQIYFDFSGYSDMAIGLGRMFGFHYHENFNHPYIARSATDFWRRWHISLGTFFRDYVYIPMGGNRKRQYLNLFVVWFLTGLWHGASWNFIFWGLYFGLLIALERLILNRVFSALPGIFSHLYLILAVVTSWGIFYFTDSTRLKTFFGILWGLSGHELWDLEVGLTLQSNMFWLILAVLACMPLSSLFRAKTADKLSPRHAPALSYAYVAANAGMLILSAAMLVGKSYNPFLYFRF